MVGEGENDWGMGKRGADRISEERELCGGKGRSRNNKRPRGAWVEVTPSLPSVSL